MNDTIIAKIDELIEKYEDRLIADTIRLVNINSEQSEALPGAPFGKGPREVLDCVIEMANDAGFYTADYNVGVVSAAMKDGQPDLGIWAHGDVVPAGEGWNFEPYNAVVYEGCIIGRGVTDNKGQLAAVFNILRIFKELGIGLKYNPALYVGSNEENGMRDMKGVEGNPDARGFVNVCTFPKLSLVPDGGFPIGHGARGMCGYRFRYNKPFDGFTLIAGQPDVPGLAKAVFDTTDIPDALDGCTVTKSDGKTTIELSTPPRHGAHPSPDGNMISKIADVLMTLDCVSDEDKAVLIFFRDVTLDITGSMFGVDIKSETMPSVYVSSKAVHITDGCPEFEVRMGYPIELTYEKIFECINKVSAPLGFTLSGDNRHKPYLRDTENAAVKALVEAANSVTGTPDAKPFVNGATYAHYLPNGYIYGMSGNLPPANFPKGRGGAHGLDECVSIARLKRAMRIYGRALLALNEVEW